MVVALRARLAVRSGNPTVGAIISSGGFEELAPRDDESGRSPPSILQPGSASSGARRLGTEAHDHLADVVAGEEPQECGHRPVDALDDRLLVPEASGLEPSADLREELRIALHVVGDDEALH